MTIAVRTNTVLAATITQTNLVAAIKAALTNAGYDNLIDDFTSGTDRILVYSKVANGNTYGTIYQRIRITSGLAIAARLYSDWNTTTHTGNNAGTEAIQTAFSSASSISFASFNAGTELNLVVAVQGSLVAPIGLLIPSVKPIWWDTNQYPFGFQFTGSGFSTWRGSALNPYTNDTYNGIINNTDMGTANSISGKRDILAGVIITSASGAGVAAKTSDDIATVSAGGSVRYDLISPQGTTTTYTIINPVPGGLAVRTA